MKEQDNNERCGEEMKKVLFVATVVKTHIMEFHIPYLKMFKEMGWETYVAAKNDYENLEDCNIPYCDYYIDIPFERSPFSVENIKAYRTLKNLINNEQFDIIHCHTPVGATLTRLASNKARKNGTKVIYTAHGFHFYKGAPVINWILYYPVEKLLASKTDVLITINKEDYEIAKGFKSGSVVHIPGVGVDLKRFHKNPELREEKRKELNINNESFIVLSVGELTHRKNHAIVLDALAVLKNRGELDDVYYYICGRGEIEQQLKSKAKALNIIDHVKFLGYREDVNELCNAADSFVFMSIQEGLPVALMEAMASGLPVICSDIRGNNDLIINGFNGELVNNDPESVAAAIISMKKDLQKQFRYSENARITIQEFELENVVKKMRSLYFYSE